MVPGESLLDGCTPCRLEITDQWLDKAELDDVFYNTAISKSTRHPDTRLALAFYTKGGQRLATFFFDAWGRAAEYNKVPVRVRGKLFPWAESLAHCR